MGKIGEKGKRSKIKARNPIIRQTLLLIDQSDLTLKDFGQQVGIHHMTIAYWRRGGNAHVHSIQAALQVLGYDLEIKKIGE